MRRRPSKFALLLFPAVVIVALLLGRWIESGALLFVVLVVLVAAAVGIQQTLLRR